MMKLEIKKRNEAGQWKHLDVNFFAGKSLQEMFTELEGTEVVIEFLFDDKRWFFCGNQYWLERMREKGSAVCFADAIERLKKINPDLLAEKIPGVDIVADVFEGATVKEHTIFEVVE